MKKTFCIRCTETIHHQEPQICRPCAEAVKEQFAARDHILENPNFDQACVNCGQFDDTHLLHIPGEFTWCEPCINAGLALPAPALS